MTLADGAVAFDPGLPFYVSIAVSVMALGLRHHLHAFATPLWQPNGLTARFWRSPTGLSHAPDDP